jgi:NADH-quinone oxidoreductase subunit N
MHNKISSGLYSVVLLNSFTVFPEYLLSVSIIYVLIVMVLITYNVYGLMIQKAISQCIALMLLMACYLMVNDDLISFGFLTFHNSIVNDYFGFFTKFIVCFSSAIYFLIIANSLKEQRLTSFEYLLINLFAVLGLMLLCSSNDLLTAYLAIELSSLAFYVLASFKKSSNYSVESGIKYFIIGAISSAFFLIGSSFIYGLTGSINIQVIFELLERSHLYSFTTTSIIFPVPIYDWITYVVWDFFYYYYSWFYWSKVVTFNHSFASEVGLSLICFSLYIKLALAPFHLWSLDVYEGSPTSTTFFFCCN